MRKSDRGGVSARGGKHVRKVLLVPAVLAVSVIATACGDDEPQLPSCFDLPMDTGTCQICWNPGGHHKECVGAPDCSYNEIKNICEMKAAA